MPNITKPRIFGLGCAFAIGLVAIVGAGSAKAYDARLDGEWTLQPGTCSLNERASANRNIGFPTEMRLQRGIILMKNGGCRFIAFRKSSVKNVWSVRLACKRGEQKWASSYLYVLRGKRLAVIDRNGMAVSYIRCP
jgi:hypothetical protein